MYAAKTPPFSAQNLWTAAHMNSASSHSIAQHPLPDGLIPGAVFALLIALSILLLIGQYTDIDLTLADLYFDSARQNFPWDKTWFGRDLMHGWVKKAVLWFGFALTALAALDLVLRFQWLDALRRVQIRLLVLASILEPMLVRKLKSSSALHCPWGVDRYGGDWPFLRLLDSVPPGWQAGHCAPAGHASVGMWLCALAVLWLPHSPRKALAAYLGGLGFGLLLGWVQQMRGQHFLSHTLWTAWIASALFVFLLAAFSRQLLAAAGSTH